MDATPGFNTRALHSGGGGFASGATLPPVFQVSAFAHESKEALYRVCDAAISFFAANAKPGERFKFTLDRVGREAFEKTINEAVDE